MLVKDPTGLWINPDLLQENPLPLRRAPDALGPSPSHLWRLIRFGRYSPVARRLIKLECVFLVNRVLATSRAAFERYVLRYNGGDAGPLPKLQMIDPRKRKKGKPTCP